MEENEIRTTILAQNKKKIIEQNADPSTSWTARVTCLSDLTDVELETTHTGLLPPPPQEEMDRISKKAEQELLAPLRQREQSLPASVDLTTMGRVSTPKDQASCGSCAAFAALSTVESCMHKATGVLPVDLSEQHLLDCAYGYGGTYGNYGLSNKGCNGGFPVLYNEWIYKKHNGGLANEAQYPYVSGKTGIRTQCKNSTIPIANNGALVG